jgi:hypothetical protein
VEGFGLGMVPVTEGGRSKGGWQKRRAMASTVGRNISWATDCPMLLPTAKCVLLFLVPFCL